MIKMRKEKKIIKDNNKKKKKRREREFFSCLPFSNINNKKHLFDENAGSYIYYYTDDTHK